MWLLAVLLTIICCLCTWSLVGHVRRKRAFAKDIPLHTPRTSFLGMDLTLAVQSDVKRFDFLIQMFLDHDHLFRMLIGPLMYIGVSHPDLMQKVLSHPDCLEKPFFYDFLQLGNGIFSAKYKLWKSQRKALNPTFNLRILNSFIPIFVDCSRRMVAELAKCKDGTTVDMFQFTAKCTLEMVCATTLGCDVLQREGKDVFLHSLEGLFELYGRRILSVELYPDFVYRLTSHYQKYLKFRKNLEDFAGKIIQEKRMLHSTTINDQESTQDVEDFRKPQIFIDQLMSLSNSRPFSDIEILENVLTLIAAGNDTSGLGVAHACLFLAIYPDIQQKVHAEVMQHFPETGDMELNADSLRHLEYTEMFIKECLRHCPVGPTVARNNLVDLELDGIKIPAGNVLVFSFFALHRRKDVWGPDADKFDPENFSPERSKDRHPYAFMPFSYGARNCIGGRYAMITMKVMIIHIVRNFELKTKLQHSDLKYKFGLTLKLPFEHSIQVFRRNAETGFK